MERISIPVKKISSGVPDGTFLVASATSLALGILTGILIGGKIILPLPANLSGVLGAVDKATVLPEAPIASPETVTMTKSDAPANDGTLGVTPVPTTDESQLPTGETNSPALFAERTALEAMIREKTLAIERNAEEIKQMKNESVSLIAEFDQNCGNWNDDCAGKYKESLEKNNASYEQLLATQALLYKELVDSERQFVATE